MEFNATIDLIIKDLNEACQIIDDLKNYPEVPELQVELAKAKCKSAGDVISLLKNIKQQPVIQKTEKISQTPVKEEVREVTRQPEPVFKTPDHGPAEENRTPVKQVKAKQPVEEPEKKPDKKIIAEKSESAPKSTSIIADKFTNKPASINEQLGLRKSEDDVTEIIKSKHIQSLKAAIGLNDRFLFVREIFNGDKEAYDQAISRLETIESTSDAKAVIFSYTGSNEENEAAKQLLDLVKRKLSPDE